MSLEVVFSFAALAMVWVLMRRYLVVSRANNAGATKPPTKATAKVLDLWTFKVYTLVCTRVNGKNKTPWQVQMFDKNIPVKPTHPFNLMHELAVKAAHKMQMEARTYSDKSLADTMAKFVVDKTASIIRLSEKDVTQVLTSSTKKQLKMKLQFDDSGKEGELIIIEAPPEGFVHTLAASGVTGIHTNINNIDHPERLIIGNRTTVNMEIGPLNPTRTLIMFIRITPNGYTPLGLVGY